MHSYTIMTENWLTQKPRFHALFVIFFLTLLTVALTYVDWTGSDLQSVLRATPENVFQQHQYYRLWTSLFVHADSAHLFSNMVLFIPLVGLLAAYFGNWLMPVLAIGLGGLINYIALKQLPLIVSLVGISGVVNWLGAVWLTLFYLIDRRENRRRRFAIVLFITFLLFVPDTYKPEVSYFSHFVGYVLGIFSGVVFYHFQKEKFRKAEVFHEIVEEEPVLVTEGSI